MDTYKFVNRVLNEFNLSILQEEYNKFHFTKRFDFNEYKMRYTLVPFFDVVQYFLIIVEYNGESMIKLYRNLTDCMFDKSNDKRVNLTNNFDREEITQLISDCIVGLFPTLPYGMQFHMLAEIMKDCYKVIDSFKDPREKLLQGDNVLLTSAGFTDYYNDYPFDVEDNEWAGSLENSRENLFYKLTALVKNNINMSIYIEENLLNRKIEDIDEYNQELMIIIENLEARFELFEVVPKKDDLMFITKLYHKDVYLDELIRKCVEGE